ncbi:MAG: Taurine--pyruvate aminotransferase [Chloroflexi bacterium ADurb.Bin180]|nr:MAG: Taurine--pyruvate aminotransferase [Chloroflexi bacterium ADurb.Bin180]
MEGSLVTTGQHLILHRTSRREMKEGKIPVIVKGEGVYVWDQAGRKYLDFVSAVTRVSHLGYGRKEIAQAMYDQACQLSYYSPFQFATQPAMEMADVLAEVAPGQISQFFFVCDGSESVEAALKLAKHYHYFRGDKQRHKVISRRGAYHGTTGGALRALGVVLPMRHIMEPVGPGTVWAESPYCYRCPLHLSYPACDLACARDVARIIEFEGPEQVSVFIGEPIQQGFGVLPAPPGYWKTIREICDRYGILIIHDEIISAFGRTGKWFASEHFGVWPDLVTMAKGLASGYAALGAVGCTEKVIEPVDTFHHIHTYGNHPVACAAALASMRIMKNEHLVQHAERMGVYLKQGLESLSGHRVFGEARVVGVWGAIDCTTDRQTRAPFPAERLASLVRRAQDKGLIIKSMGQALEFAPPLIIEKEHIDRAVRILDECLTEEEKDMNL